LDSPDPNNGPRLPDSITGDFCRELVTETRAGVAADPGSIYAYAIWKASIELSNRFDDEQGIPVDEAETIDALILPPLRRLL
jgi:hypothetical protein